METKASTDELICNEYVDRERIDRNLIAPRAQSLRRAAQSAILFATFRDENGLCTLCPSNHFRAVRAAGKSSLPLQFSASKAIALIALTDSKNSCTLFRGASIEVFRIQKG
jgi:hypothetical protein